MSLKFIDFTIQIPGKNSVSIEGEINTGECCAIMGESGCGKSTLLKSIAGLFPHQRGKLLFKEKEIQNLRAENRSISFAFQNPPFLAQFNVLKNLYFPLMFHPKYKSFDQTLWIQRARELLEKFQLENLADKDFSQLSRGEQQRINLLRALIAEPQLLLLDEPLSAIDPANKADFKKWMKSLITEAQTTCILVTHDLAEAQELGDRLLHWKNDDKNVIQIQ